MFSRVKGVQAQWWATEVLTVPGPGLELPKPAEPVCHLPAGPQAGAEPCPGDPVRPRKNPVSSFLHVGLPQAPKTCGHSHLETRADGNQRPQSPAPSSFSPATPCWPSQRMKRFCQHLPHMQCWRVPGQNWNERSPAGRDQGPGEGTEGAGQGTRGHHEQPPEGLALLSTFVAGPSPPCSAFPKLLSNPQGLVSCS